MHVSPVCLLCGFVDTAVFMKLRKKNKGSYECCILRMAGQESPVSTSWEIRVCWMYLLYRNCFRNTDLRALSPGFSWVGQSVRQSYCFLTSLPHDFRESLICLRPTWWSSFSLRTMDSAGALFISRGFTGSLALGCPASSVKSGSLPSHPWGLSLLQNHPAGSPSLLQHPVSMTKWQHGEVWLPALGLGLFPWLLALCVLFFSLWLSSALPISQGHQILVVAFIGSGKLKDVRGCCFLLSPSGSFPISVLAGAGELLALGWDFCDPHRLNQGDSSAPPSIHHSAPGSDGCLREQPPIPMAAQSPEVLLFLLFTEWLGWWWLNQWLQPREVWGAWAAHGGSWRMYQKSVDAHILPCTEFRMK